MRDTKENRALGDCIMAKNKIKCKFGRGLKHVKEIKPTTNKELS